MNVNQERMADIGYEQSLEVTEIAFVRTFGSYEPLFVTDTYQFEDYSKYEVTCFSGEEKAERKKEGLSGGLQQCVRHGGALCA